MDTLTGIKLLGKGPSDLTMDIAEFGGAPGSHCIELQYSSQVDSSPERWIDKITLVGSNRSRFDRALRREVSSIIRALSLHDLGATDDYSVMLYIYDFTKPGALDFAKQHYVRFGSNEEREQQKFNRVIGLDGTHRNTAAYICGLALEHKMIDKKTALEQLQGIIGDSAAPPEEILGKVQMLQDRGRGF